MEKSKKLMWRSRPQLRTFILFPAAKGGGGERAREGEKEGGWGGDKKENSSHLKKYTENSVKSMHTC